MQITRVIIAGILLFLGRELNFLFAAGMAILIGFRLTPLLPAQWPGYYHYIFIGLLGLIAAAIAVINERVGYFLSGFLAGGYIAVEYIAPGVLTLPLLPFLGGGVFGSLILGIFTEWAMILVSCLIGAYYVTTFFALPRTAEMLVGSGLFVIGALTQAILMRMEKQSQR
jgi:hypothetical protein